MTLEVWCIVLLLAAHPALANTGQCIPVIALPGTLPDCGGLNPPPAAACTAKKRTNLTASSTGFTISFDALLSQQKAAPYQMGLLSQCDCVCNRPGIPAEGLAPPGFLLASTNCRDPLNRTDPQCWQNKFTNISFYLANTNYTYKGVWPVADTGADGWLEGPAMLNFAPAFPPVAGVWNNITVIWAPTATSLGGSEGTLTMEVRYPAAAAAAAVRSSAAVDGSNSAGRSAADSEVVVGDTVVGRTMHHLENASNIGGNVFDWVYGASRFPLPSQSPCHHFFGELANLRVWNGVGCS